MREKKNTNAHQLVNGLINCGASVETEYSLAIKSKEANTFNNILEKAKL